jgi:outer membrane protein assembly factor BamB
MSRTNHCCQRTFGRAIGAFFATTCLLTAGASVASAQQAAKKKPAATKPATAKQASPGQAEWPQFLGPNRDGISTETGLIDRIPAKGPKEVWRVPGGIGMSGLAIRHGRVLTMVQRAGQQRLIALDADSGDTLWDTTLAPAYENQQGDGPRSTPTIAGDRVFVYTGEGILAAVSFDKGQLLWSHDVVQELDGLPADYGMACSPLVVGEQVIVIAGAPQATVVAYDVASGEQVWTAGTDDAPGYSSPTLMTIAGREQVVAYTGSSVVGIAPGAGTLLWRYPYETDFNCNIALPVAWDGRVFISAGENHGCALLALAPKDDVFDVSVAWESQGARSVMRNEWQTSILLDGHLYGLDNVGGAGPVTNLNCVEVATGQRVWQQPRFGKSNLIAAEGKLWFSTLEGELVLVRATPERFEELGRASVLGPTRQAPALAVGRLYLRDDEEIVCLDVRK